MSGFSENAILFKAYCDEVRLQIIDSLRGGEQCACDLLKRLPIGQSTLSHHMKILVQSQVVTSRRSGKWTYYQLNQKKIEHTLELIRQMTQLKDHAPSARCECE